MSIQERFSFQKIKDKLQVLLSFENWKKCRSGFEFTISKMERGQI